MDHKKIAREVLDAIGGQENVSAAAHCATRLRLVLQDESVVDQSALDNMDVVKGTFSTGGQFQIILGSGTVNEVYKHLAEMSGQTEMSTSDVKDVAYEETKSDSAIRQNAVRHFRSDYSSDCSWRFINGDKQYLNSSRPVY